MHRPPWGAEMDYNLVQKDGATTNAPAARLQQQSGRDEHSIVADAQFIDPAHGDYRVKDGSPALALGFVNFPMDQFGVQKPELKAIARTFRNCRSQKSCGRARRARHHAGDVARRERAQHRRRRRDVRIRFARCDGRFGFGSSGGFALAKAGCKKTMSSFPSTAPRRRTRRRCCAKLRHCPPGAPLKIGISRDQKEMVVQLIP
jgi:hypothetical protein